MIDRWQLLHANFIHRHHSPQLQPHSMSLPICGWAKMRWRQGRQEGGGQSSHTLSFIAALQKPKSQSTSIFIHLAYVELEKKCITQSTKLKFSAQRFLQ